MLPFAVLLSESGIITAPAHTPAKGFYRYGTTPRPDHRRLVGRARVSPGESRGPFPRPPLDDITTSDPAPPTLHHDAKNTPPPSRPDLSPPALPSPPAAGLRRLCPRFPVAAWHSGKPGGCAFLSPGSSIAHGLKMIVKNECHGPLGQQRNKG